MDPATVLGLLLGTALVAAAVFTGGSGMLFVDLPSLLLVLGGTLGATLIRNPMASVLGTFSVVRKAFARQRQEPEAIIRQVVDLSRRARRESLLALERIPVADPFLARGIALCADGVEPDQIRTILQTEIAATSARHRRGQEVLEGIGAAAPAFGMVGTLIGLVRMLASLDNPKTLAPAMGLAMLTTLYGALIAYLFALPLADKLKVISREQTLVMSVCLEGSVGIAQGEHPSAIEERLRAFVDTAARPRRAA